MRIGDALVLSCKFPPALEGSPPALPSKYTYYVLGYTAVDACGMQHLSPRVPGWDGPATLLGYFSHQIAYMI